MTTFTNPASARPAVAARRDGIRDALDVAPALLVYGVTLGVLIGSTVTGDGAGLLGAPLIYAGSAQLTATTMFQQGAGLVAIVGSVVAVNARLMVYGAALAPRFAGQPRWFRLAGVHFIIDQTYLAALRRPDHRGREFREYWLAVGFAVMAVWSAGVGLGVLIGPRLPDLPHLSLAGVALFIAMLVRRVQDAAGKAAAAVAAAVGPLSAAAMPGIGVLAGTAAGIVAGTIVGKFVGEFTGKKRRR
ncbi:MAG TPA: AzlC family ABC transporter permease [Jatrophihabitans sp.]|nr:AzlC family ABC transporter permease [Jatrophihabitans sp.]